MTCETHSETHSETHRRYRIYAPGTIRHGTEGVAEKRETAPRWSHNISDWVHLRTDDGTLWPVSAMVLRPVGDEAEGRGQ